MSYHYSSYQRTTTTNGGYATTTTTRTSSSDSLIIRELTETEVSSLPLSNSPPSQYEITDEDRLTPFDFYALMESEDESLSESSSESDVEYHWFPSLLKKSVIEFLDDNEQDQYMDQDISENIIVIENDESSEEEESTVKNGSKRFHGFYPKKHPKRPRKADLVPVEVVHVII